MKTCPSCRTQYTDDTLRFCLQDGTPLTTVPASAEPTVSLTGQEVETVARQNERAGEADASVATAWRRDSEVTRVPAPARTRSRGPTVAIATGAAALVLLFLAVFGAIGMWLYFGGPGGNGVKNTANANENRNSTSLFNFNSINFNSNGNFRYPPTPTPTATAANNGKGNFNRPVWMLTPTPADTTQASREVSRQIYSWKDDTERGDLNTQMEKYADSVEYYQRRGASPDFIRADRQRAYRIYRSMSIGISNLNISVGASGETATAVFDKEWVFEGPRRSTGKVRQQLQFRRINGEWLITGERDLKVYYTK